MTPDDQPLINISFTAHQRAKKTAIERLGRRWTPSHDRFCARWLFKRGYISDFEREQLYEQVADKVHRIRTRDPDFGRFRLW